MHSTSVKLVLLGAAEVGKSCIVQRYIQNTFLDSIPPTLGAAFMNQSLVIGSQEIILEIWDTAGQERFAALAPMYYKGAPLALVVFDVSNDQSLDAAKQLIHVHDVKQKSGTNTQIALCGNKCDLSAERWRIDSQAIQRYAEDEGVVFFLTSAKDGTNVREAFQALGEKWVEGRKRRDEEDEVRVEEVDQGGKGRARRCC